MTSSGRWGWFCAVVLTAFLLPCRGFAVDKLLIVNGTDLILRNGRREKLFGRAYTSIHDVTYEAYL